MFAYRFGGVSYFSWWTCFVKGILFMQSHPLEVKVRLSKDFIHIIHHWSYTMGAIQPLNSPLFNSIPSNPTGCIRIPSKKYSIEASVIATRDQPTNLLFCFPAHTVTLKKKQASHNRLIHNSRLKQLSPAWTSCFSVDVPLPRFRKQDKNQQPF